MTSAVLILVAVAVVELVVLWVWLLRRPGGASAAESFVRDLARLASVRSWIVWTAIVLALLFTAMFAAGSLSDDLRNFWVVVMFVLVDLWLISALVARRRTSDEERAS
jgi:hypothetical protein